MHTPHLSDWRFRHRVVILAGTLLLIPGISRPSLGQDKQIETVRQCLEKASEATRAVAERPQRNYLLAEIGLAQAASGDVAGPRTIIKQIDEPESAAALLTAIASAQAKKGDFSRASETLREAEQKALELDKNFWQKDLLHGIIDVYARIGRSDDAARVSSLFSDQINWAQAQVDIVEAQLAAGRRPEAKKTLTDVTAKFRRTLDVFDLSVWEDVCSLHLKLGDSDAALAIARAIPAGHLSRCRTLLAVAEHLGKTGKPAAASATFAEALQAARQIDNKDWVRESSMSDIVVAQVQAGGLAEAIKSVEQLPDGDSKVSAMTAVAAAQSKAGNQAAARRTLDAAIRVVEQKVRGYQQSLAFTEIALCQAGIHEKEAAAATIAKAWKAACEVDVLGWNRATCLGSAASAWAKIGDRPSAEKAFDEAVRLARSVSHWKIRADEALEIAEAQISVGFKHAAEITLRQVVLPVMPVEDWDLYYPNTKVVFLLAQAGDYDNAYALSRRFEEYQQRTSQFLTVAAYHTLAKGPQQPMAFAANERDPLLRTAVYLGTALGLLKASGVEVRHYSGLTLIEEAPP
jgi:tetratricopeptide (TPR) repeat protein